MASWCGISLSFKALCDCLLKRGIVVAAADGAASRADVAPPSLGGESRTAKLDSLTALQREAVNPLLCVVKDFVLGEEKQELTVKRGEGAQASGLWQGGAWIVIRS